MSARRELFRLALILSLERRESSCVWIWRAVLRARDLIGGLRGGLCESEKYIATNVRMEYVNTNTIVITQPTEYPK